MESSVCDSKQSVNNRNDSELCAVCNENNFKYKCPACLMKTCSVECINNHKIGYDCDGKPVNIPFKKMEDFDDKQFFKDYNFLEEGSRLLDCLRRDRKNIIKSMDQLPPWLKKLVYEARCRGTRLRILPAGFDKRNKNKTTFMYDKKEIRWDIELIFTHVTEKGSLVERPSSLVLNRVSEKRTLREIIGEVINPSDVMERIDLWKSLTSYRLTDPSSILVLLCSGKKFYQVVTDQILTKILECKTIVEYPTFLITFQKFKELFTIEVDDRDNSIDNGSKIDKDSFDKSRTNNSRRKNRRGKRKHGKGLKPHIESKISKKIESQELNQENRKQISNDESTIAPKNQNNKKELNSEAGSTQNNKKAQQNSDVSSLSTSDDEDYQKFVNIGFRPPASGV